MFPEAAPSSLAYSNKTAAAAKFRAKTNGEHIEGRFERDQGADATASSKVLGSGSGRRWVVNVGATIASSNTDTNGEHSNVNNAAGPPYSAINIYRYVDDNRCSSSDTITKLDPPIVDESCHVFSCVNFCSACGWFIIRFTCIVRSCTWSSVITTAHTSRCVCKMHQIFSRVLISVNKQMLHHQQLFHSAYR